MTREEIDWANRANQSFSSPHARALEISLSRTATAIRPAQFTIYDIDLDATRPLEQRDLDELLYIKNAYGELRHAMRETHEALQKKIAP